jgi:hypothetical protein
MKLYYLSRLNGCTNYEQYDSFVVRAENENKARIIASQRAGCEGPAAWTDTEETSCEELRRDGRERVILGSFNAG